MVLGLAMYGMSFLGTPYSWGGNDISIAVDCSGFVNEIIRSFGYIGKEDYTSEDLYSELLTSGFNSPNDIQEDDILFFGTGRITHVGIAINSWQLIESAGEGRVETDKGAVRIRPIGHRSDLIGVIRLSDHKDNINE